MPKVICIFSSEFSLLLLLFFVLVVFSCRYQLILNNSQCLIFYVFNTFLPFSHFRVCYYHLQKKCFVLSFQACVLTSNCLFERLGLFAHLGSSFCAYYSLIVSFPVSPNHSPCFIVDKFSVSFPVIPNHSCFCLSACLFSHFLVDICCFQLFILIHSYSFPVFSLFFTVDNCFLAIFSHFFLCFTHSQHSPSIVPIRSQTFPIYAHFQSINVPKTFPNSPKTILGTSWE